MRISIWLVFYPCLVVKHGRKKNGSGIQYEYITVKNSELLLQTEDTAKMDGTGAYSILIKCRGFSEALFPTFAFSTQSPLWKIDYALKTHTPKFMFVNLRRPWLSI